MSPRRRGGAITATIDPASMRELERALARSEHEARLGMADGLAQAAEAAADQERSLVPVDTGALKAGVEVRYSADGMTAKVGVFDPDLYYALFVEWGTTIRPAVPYAVPSAEAARVQFPRFVIAAVRRRVR